jgi:hypothetical protein
MANDRLYVDSSDGVNFYVMSVGNGVQQICSSLEEANRIIAKTGTGVP